MNVKTILFTCIALGTVSSGSAALQFTNVPPPVAGQLNRVTYDGTNTLVAVGLGSTVARAVFTNNPMSWASSAFPASGLRLKAVTYGNGRFVAAGQDARVFSSVSGINDWMSRNDANTLQADVEGLAFGAGRFVAPDSFVQTYWTTDLDASWTASQYQANILESYRDITSFGSNGFALCGIYGNIRVSTDGAATFALNRALDINAPDLLGIASDGTQLIVVVGAGGTILYSTGSPWTTWNTAPSVPTSATLRGVAYSDLYQLFMAVGDGGVVLTSTNGVHWTTAASPTSTALNGVVFPRAGQGLLAGVAALVGQNGTIVLGGTPPPSPVSNGDKTNCATGNFQDNELLSVQVIPDAAHPASTYTVDWFASASGTALVASATFSYRPTNTEPQTGNAPITYTNWAQSRDLRTGFVSTNRTPVRLTINPRPTATVSGDTMICQGDSTPVQVVLTGIGPWNVDWSDGVSTNGVGTNGPGTQTYTRWVNPTVTTTYTVTHLTDVNGCVAQTNELNGSATITLDTIPPVARCRDLTVDLDATGNATITPALIDSGSTDNCVIVSTNLSKTTFNCGNVGTNSVVLTVTDSNGNTNACMATVVVRDVTAPAVACQDRTVDLDAGGNGAITAAQLVASASDACGLAATNLSRTTFTCADVGTNQVTVTVTDVNGNSNACVAAVVVRDVTAPAVACQDRTVDLDAGGNGAITAAQLVASASDACGLAATNLSRTTFTCADVGTNQVTVTVTDVNGNTNACVAAVVVRDVTAPAVACQDRTVDLDAGGNGAITAAQLVASASDACGLAATNLSRTTFTCADVGTNQVTVTVTDVNGNSNACVAAVVVRDVTAPAVACQDRTVDLDAGGNGAITAAQLVASASDACGLAATNLSRTTFTCADVGTNQVTVTVTDVNGNSNACVAAVVVRDVTAPAVACQDRTVDLDAGGNGAITAAQLVASASDACGLAATNLSRTTFTCADVGTNQVTVTVTDVNGNSNACVAAVVVRDVTAPAVACQDRTVDLDAGGNGAITAAQLVASASDACGLAATNLSRTTFTCADVGTNQVTVTVTDVNGNSNACVAAVVVRDVTAPAVACQDRTVDLDAGGNGAITAAQLVASASDACGLAATNLSRTTFTCADVGTNQVTVTVTDVNGNTNACVATVTVVASAACDFKIRLEGPNMVIEWYGDWTLQSTPVLATNDVITNIVWTSVQTGTNGPNWYTNSTFLTNEQTYYRLQKP